MDLIRHRLLKNAQTNGLMLLDAESTVREVDGVIVLNHGHRWQVESGGNLHAYHAIASMIESQQDWYVVLGDRQMIETMDFDQVELERPYLLVQEPRTKANLPVTRLAMQDISDIGNLIASTPEFGEPFRLTKLVVELTRGEIFLGVRMDGLLAGFARLVLQPDLVGLFSLCVDSRYRKRGVASSLIAASYAMSRPRPLFLSSHNPEAQRLYETLGFQKGGELSVGTRRKKPRQSED